VALMLRKLNVRKEYPKLGVMNAPWRHYSDRHAFFIPGAVR
jgi:hypothetical protein